MPLTFSKPGESVPVKAVIGTDELRARLAALGFTAGTVVTIVSEIAGNLIVKVRDSRMALSRDMAYSIRI